ncbi:MAG: acetyl-CoA C-acyltransferase [Gammaproteobacteria bacterium]
MSDIVIVSAKRTPIGSFLGQFSGISAPSLGAVAIRAALEQARVEGAEVSEIMMGCVLPANLGQAPARQAAIAGGIPPSASCTTVNKVCGSGMKTIMLGHDLIKAGAAAITVAGGMESMSNAPHMIPNSRGGNRYGNFEVVDHMAWDGLTNPYDGQAMGHFGECTAERYGFTREQQDAFAVESLTRALAAQADGGFAAEIAPVPVTTRGGGVTFDCDEEPGRGSIDKIPSLRTVFRRDNGTITAASSSGISDGAAAVVLMSAAEAERRGLTPLARVVAHATHAQEPAWFTTAPVGAIAKLLQRTGWRVDDVDLFEINEAFAVVAMAAMHDHAIPHAKVNVHGGACALGHPIGASGARIVVTLLHALTARAARRGIATLCIGGGEATAIALERL